MQGDHLPFNILHSDGVDGSITTCAGTHRSGKLGTYWDPMKPVQNSTPLASITADGLIGTCTFAHQYLPFLYEACNNCAKVEGPQHPARHSVRQSITIRGASARRVCSHKSQKTQATQGTRNLYCKWKHPHNPARFTRRMVCVFPFYSNTNQKFPRRALRAAFSPNYY